MPGTGDFLLRMRLDATVLEAWVEAGWLAPQGDPQGGCAERAFSEMDIARACLIRDLREELGVNDEGVTVILRLLDQVHGLRLALRRLSSVIHTLPEPLRQQALAALREAVEDQTGRRPARPLERHEG